MSLGEVKWDQQGLVVVIAQEQHSGEIRMVAYANQEALSRTLATGEAHFYSRSRGALWRKGETSGNGLTVREVRLDCDGDALLFVVDAQGPSCHTGERNCFFRQLREDNETQSAEQKLVPTLFALQERLARRAQESGEKSYTRSLLERGADVIAEKISEEAQELGDAIRSESQQRVASESADVLYHLLVGLLSRGVSLEQVSEELAQRFGQSGLEEKASRTPKH